MRPVESFCSDIDGMDVRWANYGRGVQIDDVKWLDDLRHLLYVRVLLTTGF
jgi:hypothetical protein